MAESYSVKAVLSALDKGFTSTLKSASNTVDSLGNKLKSGLGFGILTGIGQQAFASITSGARGLIGEMNSANAAWKTFAGNMQIMGKGEDEISAVKKELQSFAEQTIYNSSDMAQTYAQLAAVGTKNTTQLVKGFGGLASAAENPKQAMKTLSQQGTQMAARPMVAWMDFKLMLEQTPAGMAAVAKQMGMTTSELVAGVQAGTVSTKQFFNAIEKVGTSDAFTTLATQYKTAGQAMDGLKETLSNKLSPAFDMLSGVASGGISKIIDKLEKLDGQKVADKVSGWIKKVQPYYDSFVKGVSKIGKIVAKVGSTVIAKFKAMGVSVGGSVKKVLKWFESINVDSVAGKITAFLDSLEPFISAFRQVGAEAWRGLGAVLSAVIGILPKITDFLSNNRETIAKVMPWILRAVLAFKGFQVLKSVIPGFGLLTNAIGGLIKSGISKLSGKLLGAGKAAATSGADMLKSAGGFLMMGAGVMLISLGFAMLAQSAIALAAAGSSAIAVMAGMTVALVGLVVGMAFLMQMLAPMAGQLISVGAAFLMMGAAVLFIGAGFNLLATAAVALAAAGWPAIAVMVGIIAVIALLAVALAILGPCLTAGALGLLAFGAAVLMVGAGFTLMGVGALLAVTALQLLVTVLPQLAANGLQGALAIAAIGAALLVFGAAALTAGAGALVLGAGLLVIGVAVLTIAAGFMVMSVATMLAATGLTMFAAVLPLLAANGLKGSAALVVLGAALVVFGAGALLAGTGTLMLGTGLLLCAAAILTLSAGATLAAAALGLLSLTLPTLAAHGMHGAAVIMALSAALIVFAAGAVLAGAGAMVGVSGVMAFGAAMVIAGAGAMIMSAGLLGVTTQMQAIAKNAKSAERSLNSMQGSLLTAPAVAMSAIRVVANILQKGYANAYDAGTYIGKGFAAGIKSCLGRVRSAAMKMAAAADKAARAKLKIKSPSRVAEKSAGYYGEGWINSLKDMRKKVWDAAQNLVSMPTLSTPDFALAYAGEMSADYEYYRNATYTIVVPVEVDGKEIARTTAPYTEAELNKRQKRDERKNGRR